MSPHEEKKKQISLHIQMSECNNVVKPLQVHVAKYMSLFIKLFECKLCGDIFTEVNMTKTSSYVVKHSPDEY